MSGDAIPSSHDPQRWEGVERPYDAEALERLRGSVQVEHTLARNGAERLWKLLHERDHVAALGASTGNQAVQQVRAGLEAIYCPAGRWPPTRTSRARCTPTRACIRSTACPTSSGRSTTRCCAPTRSTTPTVRARSTGCVPIVADTEAGFGGHLNAFELTRR